MEDEVKPPGDPLGQIYLPSTIREAVSIPSNKIANMRKTMFCLNCEKYHSN